jgi:type IV pilus assembly protein PilC
MPTFQYKVRDESGRAITGKMQAASAPDVIGKLRNLRYTIISVSEIRPLFTFKFEMPTLMRGIKDEDYVMYTAQLSSLLAAGLPLSASLDTMIEQTEHPQLKKATEKVVQDVREGASFAEALREHPKVFSNLYVNTVAAGEISGNLEEVLLRLTSYMEKTAEFKQKVMTALFYPLTLVTFSILVIIVIIITVLPTFIKMYASSGIPLPLPTRILYGINLLIRGWWHVILITLGLGIVGFNYAKQTKLGKAILDRVALDIPIWGTLNRKVNIARFSRTLASLLTAGVPLLESLEISEQTTDNSVFSQIIKSAHDEVSKGRTLADQLKSSGEFPPMPIQMIAVGEEAGRLDQMLGKVADFYEMSVDYTVKRLTSILEPILLVVIGGAVGFIFASVLLPIFSMVQTIGR